MPQFLSPLPLAAFEEYMLRDDRPEHPMTMLARLRFAGRLNRTAADAALEQVIARHPLLRAKVANDHRGRLQWIPANERPAIRWLDSLPHDDLPAMPPIDLTKEAGLRAWAASGSPRSTLVLQVHHAACDGKAVMQIADDFVRCYARNVGGKNAAIELAPLDASLLPRRAKFGLTKWKLLKMLPAQLSGLTGAWKFLLQQPVPLLANVSGTPSVPDSLHRYRTARLAANELRRLSAIATEQRATLNDLLLRDFFVAIDDFRHRHGAAKGKEWLRVSVPINLRLPADAMLPAANVVSMVFLDRRSDEIADKAKLLQGVHDTIAMNVRRRLGLTLIWSLMALRALPGGLAARVNNGRCEATCVLSNLGRALADSPLPRQGGKIVAGDVALDGIDFFVPIRDGTAASAALVFYGEELQICMRFDGRSIDEAQADDLLATYLRAIRATRGAEDAAATREKAA